MNYLNLYGSALRLIRSFPSLNNASPTALSKGWFPISIYNKEVLPAPLFPSKTIISEESIEKEISFITKLC